MAGDDTFRWNDWNREHATRHSCTVREIEAVVRRARRHEARNIGDGKMMIVGRGTGDWVIQVAYVVDPHETLYVIHAMPLTTRRRR